MDAARWQELSPLLDALLALDAKGRAHSLALTAEQEPALAEQLRQLLALDDEASFLDESILPRHGARPGAQIGPYRLNSLLGEGGMGQVWLASRADGLYKKRVALKLLRPGLADPNLRLRFTRERQILARLEHPHIARLFDAGISADDKPYLALEYIEGEPITQWCRQQGASVHTVLRLFGQVCSAVSHAHANLVVHRDLKPSNVLVTALDEVRLLDFGIAKLLDSEVDAPENTRTGTRAFTLHYAAPEQILGEAVTTMTDVYALGALLYRLLAGVRPFKLKHETDAQWEDAVLQHDIQRPSQALLRDGGQALGLDAPSLRKRARIIAGDLDNIVLKAMARQPQQRYSSVEALALDIQRFCEGQPVQARPQRLHYRIGKLLMRHRWPVVTAASVLIVLIAAGGMILFQARMQQAEIEALRMQCGGQGSVNADAP